MGAGTRQTERVGKVRVLAAADVEAAASVLARAFLGDAGAAGLFPDADERRWWAEANATRWLERSLPHASVHGVDVDGRLASVAIWDPPGVTPRSLPATLRLTREALGRAPTVGRAMLRLAPSVVGEGRAILRLGRERQCAVQQVTREPAWHLAYLATAPERQGEGLARRLLDHVLGRCDADGLGAWLETTEPTNPPRYERFGFETVASIAGVSWVPHLWVMHRPPSGSSR